VSSGREKLPFHIRASEGSVRVQRIGYFANTRALRQVELVAAAIECGDSAVPARTRSQDGRAVDVGAFPSQRSEQPLSSNNDGCSAEDKQGHSSTMKNVPWGDLDERRWLAYIKEKP
jgi:hypothetical protein